MMAGFVVGVVAGAVSVLVVVRCRHPVCLQALEQYRRRPDGVNVVVQTGQFIVTAIVTDGGVGVVM
jgi:hypothetical protein